VGPNIGKKRKFDLRLRGRERRSPKEKDRYRRTKVAGNRERSIQRGKRLKRSTEREREMLTESGDGKEGGLVRGRLAKKQLLGGLAAKRSL